MILLDLFGLRDNSGPPTNTEHLIVASAYLVIVTLFAPNALRRTVITTKFKLNSRQIVWRRSQHILNRGSNRSGLFEKIYRLAGTERVYDSKEIKMLSIDALYTKRLDEKLQLDGYLPVIRLRDGTTLDLTEHACRNLAYVKQSINDICELGNLPNDIKLEGGMSRRIWRIDVEHMM